LYVSLVLFKTLMTCCFCKHGSQRVVIPHFLTFLTPSFRLLSYLALHLCSRCSLASCMFTCIMYVHIKWHLPRWLFRFDFFLPCLFLKSKHFVHTHTLVTSFLLFVTVLRQSLYRIPLF
jgi:hypothetical protein